MPVIEHTRVETIGGARMLVMEPDAPRGGGRDPLILFFHGSGGSLEGANNLTEPSWELMRRGMRARGYYVAVPDCGPFHWMGEAGERVAVAALDGLEASGAIDPRRVVVMGVSMGGASALTFAALHARRVRAVCAIMPVTDHAGWLAAHPEYAEAVHRAFGGGPGERPEAYRRRSAVAQARTLSRLPLLLLHGREDALAEPRQSEALYSEVQALGGRAELIVVPGVGHEHRIIAGHEDRVLDFLDSAGAKR